MKQEYKEEAVTRPYGKFYFNKLAFHIGINPKYMLYIR